jgi:uncharacterized protein
MNKIAPLIQKMIKYNHGNAKRISHALKVHNYAKTIAILEKVNEYDLFNLESAAILHDIGIKVCEKKYNSTEGKLQEKEGPTVAREILENLDYKNINRILFLIKQIRYEEIYWTNDIPGSDTMYRMHRRTET